MRILTFNTGCAQLRLGPIRIDLVPRLAKRLHALAEELRSIDADIVCLQEVFRADHARILARALAERYPFSWHDPARGFRYNSGLLVFSKHPVEHAGSHQARARGVEVVAPKGAAFFTLSDGPHAGVAFANVHLPYGGFSGTSPEDRWTIEHRNQDLITIDEKLRALSDRPLMVGDLNFGPNCAPENHTFLQSLGYISLTAHAISWDVSNPLNLLFKDAWSKSIDHIALHGGLLERIAGHTHELVFDREVRLSCGTPSFLSDHYGHLCELRLT